MPDTSDDVTEGYAGYLRDRLHRAHLDERRRVARELHDLVAHSVAVALQDLELFTAHRHSDAARAETKLAAAMAHLRDALDVVRTTGRSLRLSAAERGLTATLRAYLDSLPVEWQTELTVAGDERPVPPAVQGELFLVIREAVRNAHLHGDAPVWIRVAITPDRVRVIVEDNGDGFHCGVPRATPVDGGLASMQERTALLGGEIRVCSAPGEGTSIQVDVPLAKAWDESDN